MESETYKDWTINIQELDGEFTAVLLDSDGKKFDEAVIHISNPESAEQYTNKIINWCIKLKKHLHTLKVTMTIKSEIYKDWTINIREINGGFTAFLIDSTGKKFDEVVICLPSAESAEQYAHKVINWWIKLEEQRKLAENSYLAQTILPSSS
jgi:hypothetical protein